MPNLTKEDCRILLAAVKPSQLGAKGKHLYARLFQSAFGVPPEMIKLLTKNRMTVKDLTDKLDISRRTVFRYLNEIEQAGGAVDFTAEGYQISKPGKLLAPLDE